MNRFTWGNIKSLRTHKPGDLLKDLRNFFNQHYSADRMKLVVQTKTEDGMVELRKQVIEIFS
jgi:secreted Zn-dependent insulinase-like peptidase